MNTKIRTIKEKNEKFNEVIRELSPTTIDDIFSLVTNHLKFYHDEKFNMVTRLNGELIDDQGNTRLQVYVYGTSHEETTNRMVIKTYDEEIEDEIATLYGFHNFDIEIS